MGKDHYSFEFSQIQCEKRSENVSKKKNGHISYSRRSNYSRSTHEQRLEWYIRTFLLCCKWLLVYHKWTAYKYLIAIFVDIYCSNCQRLHFKSHERRTAQLFLRSVWRSGSQVLFRTQKNAMLGPVPPKKRNILAISTIFKQLYF